MGCNEGNHRLCVLCSKLQEGMCPSQVLVGASQASEVGNGLHSQDVPANVEMSPRKSAVLRPPSTNMSEASATAVAPHRMCVLKAMQGSSESLMYDY
jgi:hypothetical protein